MCGYQGSLAEIYFCARAAPVIICGAILLADLDSLVTTIHPDQSFPAPINSQ